MWGIIFALGNVEKQPVGMAMMYGWWRYVHIIAKMIANQDIGVKRNFVITAADNYGRDCTQYPLLSREKKRIVGNHMATHSRDIARTHTFDEELCQASHIQHEAGWNGCRVEQEESLLLNTASWSFCYPTLLSAHLYIDKLNPDCSWFPGEEDPFSRSRKKMV